MLWGVHEYMGHATIDELLLRLKMYGCLLAYRPLTIGLLQGIIMSSPLMDTDWVGIADV